jgi:hypothetical protein
MAGEDVVRESTKPQTSHIASMRLQKRACFTDCSTSLWLDIHFRVMQHSAPPADTCMSPTMTKLCARVPAKAFCGRCSHHQHTQALPMPSRFCHITERVRQPTRQNTHQLSQLPSQPGRRLPTFMKSSSLQSVHHNHAGTPHSWHINIHRSSQQFKQACRCRPTFIKSSWMV